MLAAGIGLLVLGGFLLVTPIDVGPTVSTSMHAGNWEDIDVPWSASVAGMAVDVNIAWRYSPPSCPGGVKCGGWVNNPASLLLLDCGSTACIAGGDYSAVGSTDMAAYGVTGFGAVPGHHYQLWVVEVLNLTGNNASIPVRYSLQTPVLGGVLGGAIMVGGAVAAIQAVRRYRPPPAVATLPA